MNALHQVRVVAYHPEEFECGRWTLAIPGISGSIHAENPEICMQGDYVGQVLAGKLYLDYARLEGVDAAAPSFAWEASRPPFGDEVELTGSVLRFLPEDEAYLVRSVLDIVVLLDKMPDKIFAPGSWLKVRGTLYFERLESDDSEG